MAAALRVPMSLENVLPRFEEQSLDRIEHTLFDNASNQGIELPTVRTCMLSQPNPKRIPNESHTKPKRVSAARPASNQGI